MTTPAARIPRPEELVAKQQQEVNYIATRRRTFMETSGQRVADHIIAELVKMVQSTGWQEWTEKSLACETANVVALCDNDRVLALTLVSTMVAPVMHAAGWRVAIGCLGDVLIGAIKRDKENDDE